MNRLCRKHILNLAENEFTNCIYLIEFLLFFVAYFVIWLLKCFHVFLQEYVAEIEGLIKSNAAKDKIKNCFAKMWKMLFFDEVEAENRRIPVGLVQKRFAEVGIMVSLIIIFY